MDCYEVDDGGNSRDKKERKYNASHNEVTGFSVGKVSLPILAALDPQRCGEHTL